MDNPGQQREVGDGLSTVVKRRHEEETRNGRRNIRKKCLFSLTSIIVKRWNLVWYFEVVTSGSYQRVT